MLENVLIRTHDSRGDFLEKENTNRSYCHVAYKQFTWQFYRRLGNGNRRAIPPCAFSLLNRVLGVLACSQPPAILRVFSCLNARALALSACLLAYVLVCLRTCMLYMHICFHTWCACLIACSHAWCVCVLTRSHANVLACLPA